MKHEQRDFKVWLEFFSQPQPSLTRFIHLMNHKDNYFLTHPLQVDFDDELYERVRPGGFLEEDVQKILVNDNPKDSYFKTRLALAMEKNLDFSLVRQRINHSNFVQVLETMLIDGQYEQYGVPYEKLVGQLIAKQWLPRTSLVDVSFLRGVSLGSRYTEQQEAKLNWLVKKNKLKIRLGL